jgi:hypothetical protein
VFKTGIARATLYTLFSLCLLLVFTACGREPSEEIVSTPTAEAPPEVVQVEAISPISPILTTEPEEIPEIPTPEPGTGALYGQAGHPSPQVRIWGVGRNFIYLAPLVYTKNDQGTPIVPLVRLDVENDRRVELRVGDYFIFTNLMPGEYAFVLVNPIENYVVPGDHSSGFKIVNVADGQIIDIGVLSLP